jgi:two-component sensor histidine kinase
VEWEVKDSDSGRLFCFRWQEHDQNNDNEIAKPPFRQGFGTKLLTRLVPADLSGCAAVKYESGSFSYELEAPVEAVVEQEPSALINGKGLPTARVIHGRPDAEELSA